MHQSARTYKVKPVIGLVARSTFFEKLLVVVDKIKFFRMWWAPSQDLFFDGS